MANLQVPKRNIIKKNNEIGTGMMGQLEEFMESIDVNTFEKLVHGDQQYKNRYI